MSEAQGLEHADEDERTRWRKSRSATTDSSASARQRVLALEGPLPTALHLSARGYPRSGHGSAPASTHAKPAGDSSAEHRASRAAHNLATMHDWASATLHCGRDQRNKKKRTGATWDDERKRKPAARRWWRRRFTTCTRILRTTAPPSPPVKRTRPCTTSARKSTDRLPGPLDKRSSTMPSAACSTN